MKCKLCLRQLPNCSLEDKNHNAETNFQTLNKSVSFKIVNCALQPTTPFLFCCVVPLEYLNKTVHLWLLTCISEIINFYFANNLTDFIGMHLEF